VRVGQVIVSAAERGRGCGGADWTGVSVLVCGKNGEEDEEEKLGLNDDGVACRMCEMAMFCAVLLPGLILIPLTVFSLFRRRYKRLLLLFDIDMSVFGNVNGKLKSIHLNNMITLA
jgi:hypothetical protein